MRHRAPVKRRDLDSGELGDGLTEVAAVADASTSPETIDAIAERADVSRKTVFTAMGGKATVLKLAFDWTLAGDDEPVPIADPAEVRRMMQGTDLGGLRPDLDKDRATAIADVLIDPEPFRRLMLRHGWTPDQYTEHLQRMATAALLT